MDIVTIMFISIGLAMDCFAVALSNGINSTYRRNTNAIKMATFFGMFQAIMPLLGWSAGLNMANLISGVDHWIAFGLLALIGCRMVVESKKKDSTKSTNSPNLYVLLALSVATSIDALAVGLSFAFLKTSIFLPTIIIGTLAFLLSLLGILVGNKFGRLFGRNIEIAGGLILITIGARILFEHLA